MGIGLKGSNGGIGASLQNPQLKNITPEILEKFFKIVCEQKERNIYLVDLFVNNRCNLSCKHCYIKYTNSNDELSIEEIKDSLLQLKEMGARIFGIVGKEPLLSWEKTKAILSFLKEIKKEEPEVRYGIVTNGILLDDLIAKELKEIDITYLDLSVDGGEEIHDLIRGEGSYRKTLNAFRNLKNNGLGERVTISFTLNNLNKNSFIPMVHELQKEGIKKFLVSPYLSQTDKDSLKLSVEDYFLFVQNVLNKLQNNLDIEVYFKNDIHSKEYQIKLVESGFINLNRLVMDNHLAFWDIKEINGNRILFNFQPWETYKGYGIRLSHDGYVSDCFSMLFKDYPTRKEVIGNVKEKPIKEILKPFIIN